MKYAFHVSPNLKGNLTTQGIMRELTLGLSILYAIACIYQFVAHGAGNLIHTIVLLAASLVTMFIIEIAFARIRKQDVKESVMHSFGWVTCLILVLIIPVTMTWYAVVISTIFAILFGKLIFGGFGHNVFNPAGVGRAVIASAFITASAANVISSATPTTTLANTYNWLPTTGSALGGFFSTYKSFTNLFLGFYDGALGETFTWAIALIGIWFCIRKIIDWRVPVVYLGSIFIFTAVISVLCGIEEFHGIPSILWYPALHLLTGGVVFGAVFMLTDPVTSPTSAQGRVVFALGAAVITVLLRTKSNMPEGCLYSILLMNTFTPLIENALDGPQLAVRKKALIMIVCLFVLGLALCFYAAATIEPVTSAATSFLYSVNGGAVL